MEKEVVWTAASLLDRFEIYSHWVEKIGNDKYAEQLDLKFEETASLLAEFPSIGVTTNIDQVRFIVVKDYKLFYQQRNEQCIILRVWDTRRNPEYFSA